MVNTMQDFFADLYKNLLSDPGTRGESYGDPTTLRYLTSDEAVRDSTEGINKVTKVGYTLPFSWEALVGSQRKGHYEPVGNKYTQWLAWWFGKQVFRLWTAQEKFLRKFRHFEGVGGYDWEEAEYREFKQKTRWVEDDEQST